MQSITLLEAGFLSVRSSVANVSPRTDRSLLCTMLQSPHLTGAQSPVRKGHVALQFIKNFRINNTRSIGTHWMWSRLECKDAFPIGVSYRMQHTTLTSPLQSTPERCRYRWCRALQWHGRLLPQDHQAGGVSSIAIHISIVSETRPNPK